MEILRANPYAASGYYKVKKDDDTLQQVYCNMCALGEGWTRIAFLNMSDPSEQCPSGFGLYQSNGVRACGRPATEGTFSCVSTMFPSNGQVYSQVCGRVVGYQRGTTDAVDDTLEPGSHNYNIDSHYVDDVSLTRGLSPHEHIWTFMAGLQEELVNNFQCPCNVDSVQASKVQSFVGSNSYCESGVPQSTHVGVLYTSDPLWDGQQCSSEEATCCQVPGIPWFHRVLPSGTSDSIEPRVCADQLSTRLR